MRKPRINKYGYLVLTLSKDGKAKTHQLHRVVASAFVDNPFNKEQINHKDGNKENNKVSNLEWVTSEENINHAIKTGLRNDNYTPKRREALEKAHKQNKVPVIQKSKAGETLRRFESLSDASLFVKGNNSVIGCISKACNGKQKTAYGYVWEYE